MKVATGAPVNAPGLKPVHRFAVTFVRHTHEWDRTHVETVVEVHARGAVSARAMAHRQHPGFLDCYVFGEPVDLGPV